MSNFTNNNSSCKKWMVIDTDAGVDDAFALAMAVKHAAKHEYEVKLFTTVFGNCSLEQVIKNVSKFRAAANSPHVNISRGCEYPIVKEGMLDAAYFHGLDGMGNNSFPDEESGIDSDAIPAPQQLVDIAKEAKRQGVEMTLVMMGPLTNLAAAVSIDSQFVKNVNRLVIMGGCGNGRGNIFRTAEFNVVADPDAADVVLRNLVDNNKMCTVVSWELTMDATVPWKLFDDLNNEETTRVQGSESEHGAVICDAVAIAVAICEPEDMIIQSQAVNVEVELAGTLTRGQTVVDWGCFDGVQRKANCHWITEIDLEKYLDMFKVIYD